MADNSFAEGGFDIGFIGNMANIASEIRISGG
jgi:hypothetical protein